MNVIEIPFELTGEEALAIVRVLERIVDTLWKVHGEEMSHILEAAADECQNELPF